MIFVPGAVRAEVDMRTHPVCAMGSDDPGVKFSKKNPDQVAIPDTTVNHSGTAVGRLFSDYPKQFAGNPDINKLVSTGGALHPQHPGRNLPGPIPDRHLAHER